MPPGIERQAAASRRKPRSGSGANHYKAKLSTSQIDFIRQLHEDYHWGYRAIAGVFGISRDTVRHICLYRRRCIG